MTDEEYMQLAIEAAKQGDYPYGAVLVKDDAVVASGYNTVKRDEDTTAHAEMNVIREVEKNLSILSFGGYTLYTTGESCPMCTGAEIWARVSRVVYGASIEQLAQAGQLQITLSSETIIQAGFDKIDLKGGVLAQEVLQLFQT